MRHTDPSRDDLTEVDGDETTRATEKPIPSGTVSKADLALSETSEAKSTPEKAELKTEEGESGLGEIETQTTTGSDTPPRCTPIEMPVQRWVRPRSARRSTSEETASPLRVPLDR
jgi:hypothetical protein